MQDLYSLFFPLDMTTFFIFHPLSYNFALTAQLLDIYTIIDQSTENILQSEIDYRMQISEAFRFFKRLK